MLLRLSLCPRMRFHDCIEGYCSQNRGVLTLVPSPFHFPHLSLGSSFSFFEVSKVTEKSSFLTEIKHSKCKVEVAVGGSERILMPPH
jgi:hypothetical protein